MRKFLLPLCFLCLSLATLTAAAGPVLVLVDRADQPTLPSAVVLRELRHELILAVEPEALAEARVAYTLLDPDYEPGHYLFVRPGRVEAGRVLWQSAGQALVKFDEPVKKQGGVSVLEKAPPVVRESRRPSSLDDPVLDAWLQTLADSVNADSLYAYVEELAFFNRYTRWLSNQDAVNWVRDKFLSFGMDSVYLHGFTAHGGSGWQRATHNIIAVLPGTESPDSIVMIGAHMDATSQNTAGSAPGAEDNASGTAAVLEAARLLSGTSFRHTLMFVAFNAEEQGLQGSEALALQMDTENRRVIGLLNMDMIGYYDPAGADLWIEGFYSGTNSIWLCNALWDNCVQYTTLEPYLYPNNGWGSDHESFHDRGFVAVLAIENEFDLYPCYHRTCDLPAQLTPDFLRQMALVNIVTGAELAAPHLPPAPVADLTAAATPAGISLRWSPTTDATSYLIYRGTTFNQPISEMTLLTTQVTTTYLDPTPALLQAFYLVIAEN